MAESALAGMRVAILEGRMSSEMAALVRRHGGEPYSVPSVGEAPLGAGRQVADLISALDRGDIKVTVFLTGAGARALFREADELGRLPALLTGLRRVTTACRGPKPSAALARHEVPVSVSAREPHTTAELLIAMEQLNLQGAITALVHYGQRDERLAETLQARGARPVELCLYEWRLPDDLGPLQTLVGDIIAGHVNAIAFTSQVQAKHLFQVAQGLGQTANLVAALNTKTIVASLAPTCAGALRALGVEPHVIPEHGKMGHLVGALARHVQRAAATIVPPPD